MTTDNLPTSTGYVRDHGGRFVAGNSGRVPGSKNKVSRDAVNTIRSLSDEAFRVLKANLALNDHRACAYVLDRILPAGRVVELDDITANGISGAVADGTLSVEELKSIASAVSALKRVEEIDQLRAELDQLRRLLEG